MEQRVTSNEQGNKTKNHITLSTGKGGGGIAGLLVFGGALTVTGLIAVASFASKKSKTKDPPHITSSPLVETPPQESDDTSQGIPSLQDLTTNHENACYKTSITGKDQIDSCQSLASQTLILEEKPDLKIKTYIEEESATSLHQEILLSDDSPPESAASSNDNGIGEDCLESSIDSPCFKVVDQSESQEPLKSVEIHEGQHDNIETEGEREDDIVKEDNDDVALEASENSSEAAGRTSLDSNEAAIWPAELIEEKPQQTKGEMIDEQSEAEGTAKPILSLRHVKSHGGVINSEFSEYAGIDEVMASAETTSSEKANLYVALNHHLSVLKSKPWVIPLLLSALLLLILLTLHNRISGSSYASDVNGGNSVISHDEL